jgi:hypothetical protein
MSARAPENSEFTPGGHGLQARAAQKVRSGYDIGQQAAFYLADFILDGQFLLLHARYF